MMRFSPLVLVVLAACQAPPQNDGVAGWLEVLDEDGSWCWFQTERSLLVDGKLLVGSVAAGTHDPERKGDIDLLVHDLGIGTTRRVELHDRLQRDDHNVPGLARLADGGVIALYARHGNDAHIRQRIGRPPFAAADWSAEVILPQEAVGSDGVTYNNVFRLQSSGPADAHGASESASGGSTASAGSVLINFYRGPGWDPNAIRSGDGGRTWQRAGKLLDGPGRPYVRYASDGVATIHFVCTDQHPRNADNSIYHGFLRDGRIHASDGSVVGALGDGVPPERLTRIFAGGPQQVGWVSDVRVDGDGHPVVVYSVQMDSAGLPVGQGGKDHRYRYARWDGRQWHDEQVAYAGRRLYPREDDYTGLIVVDPGNPKRVYFSSDADPRTGRALISAADGKRHHEIFQADRGPRGAWTFTPLTWNSSVDNLRPLVPGGDRSPRTLLWLRGSYTTYQDFAQQVVLLRLDHFRGGRRR